MLRQLWKIYQSPQPRAIKQSQIQNQVDVAVLGKVQQVQQQQGEAVVELIEQAANVQEQLAKGHLDVKL